MQISEEATNLSLKDFHVSTIKSSSNEIHLNVFTIGENLSLKVSSQI